MILGLRLGLGFKLYLANCNFALYSPLFITVKTLRVRVSENVYRMDCTFLL